MNGDVVREQHQGGPLQRHLPDRRPRPRRPQGGRGRLSGRPHPPPHARGIGPLRGPPRGDHRRRTEAPAHATSTGPCSTRRNSPGIIEARHDPDQRTGDRPPRLPQAGRAELADARRAAAGRPGRADAAAGAVDHPPVARRRPEPARDLRPASRYQDRRRHQGDRDRRPRASSSPRGSSNWPSRWARSR